MSDQRIYDSCARILGYPREDYGEVVQYCLSAFEERAAMLEGEENELTGCVAGLRAFTEAVLGLTPTEREELFTQTFDINPVASLDIGWQLFGEQYERGAFLVKMRELLRTHGIEESTELPDNLVHALPLLARMSRQEATELAASSILPALGKILDGFAGKSNPYEHLLKAILVMVEHDYSTKVEE